MFRVAIITDLHLRIGEEVYGKDTERNFHLLLEDLKTWELSYIACLGDISAVEPRREDLLFAKRGLDELGIAYDVIRGNHDLSKDIADVFGYDLQGHELYYTKHVGNRDFLYLDTGEGEISDAQCLWLSKQLGVMENPIIMMHYPPSSSGIPFMDAKHRFKDDGKLMDVFTKNIGAGLNIFCGHCHAERTMQWDELSVHLTPSCIAQIDERALQFKMYHDLPAYRIVEFTDRRMDTFVKYIFYSSTLKE